MNNYLNIRKNEHSRDLVALRKRGYKNQCFCMRKQKEFNEMLAKTRLLKVKIMITLKFFLGRFN